MQEKYWCQSSKIFENLNFKRILQIFSYNGSALCFGLFTGVAIRMEQNVIENRNLCDKKPVHIGTLLHEIIVGDRWTLCGEVVATRSRADIESAGKGNRFVSPPTFYGIYVLQDLGLFGEVSVNESVLFVNNSKVVCVAHVTVLHFRVSREEENCTTFLVFKLKDPRFVISCESDQMS